MPKYIVSELSAQFPPGADLGLTDHQYRRRQHQVEIVQDERIPPKTKGGEVRGLVHVRAIAMLTFKRGEQINMGAAATALLSKAAIMELAPAGSDVAKEIRAEIIEARARGDELAAAAVTHRHNETARRAAMAEISERRRKPPKVRPKVAGGAGDDTAGKRKRGQDNMEHAGHVHTDPAGGAPAGVPPAGAEGGAPAASGDPPAADDTLEGAEDGGPNSTTGSLGL